MLESISCAAPRQSAAAPSGLEAEFTAARDRLDARHVDHLRALGVPHVLIKIGTLIGASRVDFDGEYFQPDQAGSPALILAVRGDGSGRPRPRPRVWALCGPVVDLVAFNTSAPSQWATRRGAAVALGCPLFEPRQPGVVHRDPLAWLRAGGDGLCPLTRDPRELQTLLLGIGDLAALDVTHARELRRIVSTPWAAPRVLVASERRSA